MSLTWFVGNRNPSITENIIDDQNAAVDLSASSVFFRGRAFGSTALIVSGSAVIESPPSAGHVRYDWSAADAATGALASPKEMLVWWEVTTGGKQQDMMESRVEVLAHAPLTHCYVELEEFKATTELSSTSYADSDIRTSLLAASRGIDDDLGRRFWLDADAQQVREYTSRTRSHVEIDDLVELTSVKIDRMNSGLFDETWTLNTDYVLEPLNAADDAKPWETIRVLPYGNYLGLPECGPRNVRVTGRFGWPEVPSAIRALTTLVATRLLRRTREAPFGIVSFGMDGAVVRASQFASDPEYNYLTKPYRRTKVLV